MKIQHTEIKTLDWSRLLEFPYVVKLQGCSISSSVKNEIVQWGKDNDIAMEFGAISDALIMFETPEDRTMFLMCIEQSK